MRSKTILELTSKEFLMTLRVNVLGTFNIVHEFLPSICARNHGHIVTIASTASFASPPGMSDYSTSKAGIMAFHEVMTAEIYARMNATNVRTTVICPVKVRTPLGSIVEDHKSSWTTPVQEPWQVAEKIVQAVRLWPLL